MNILIIGASGLVGSHLLAEALARGHEVIGTYRNTKTTGYKLWPLDLAEDRFLVAMLDLFKIDWVIHSAGWTDADGCEGNRPRCFEQNYTQPVLVGDLCKARGIRYCYVSSVYAKWPKLNAYATAKAQAEVSLMASLGKTVLIPRLISVWGKDANQKCFPYAVQRAHANCEVMRLPSDQIITPTWAGDAAYWIMRLMESEAAGVTAMAGDVSMTRPQWAEAVCPSVRVRAVKTRQLGQKARRPLNCSTANTAIQSLFPRRCRPASDFLKTIAN